MTNEFIDTVEGVFGGLHNTILNDISGFNSTIMNDINTLTVDTQNIDLSKIIGIEQPLQNISQGLGNGIGIIGLLAIGVGLWYVMK